MYSEILVAGGGNSPERDISLSNSKDIIEEISKMGFSCNLFDPKKQKLSELENKPTRVVFNSLYGGIGENGVLQNCLDIMKNPYTNSGAYPCLVTINKNLTQKICSYMGIKTPQSTLYKGKEFLDKLKTNSTNMRYPYIIKNNFSGSSLEIEYVDQTTVNNIINNWQFKDNDVLSVENYIPDKEISALVYEGDFIGITEICYPGKIFSFHDKYVSKNYLYKMSPDIKKNTLKEVIEISEKLFNVLLCKGAIRIDFKVLKDQPYLLEINSNPALGKNSLATKIFKHHGFSYKNIIKSLIDKASFDNNH